MIKTKLFRLNRWLGNLTWNKRYAYLMVRDRQGVEKFERNQLMKIKRLSGRYANWALSIKVR